MGYKSELDKAAQLPCVRTAAKCIETKVRGLLFTNKVEKT